MKELATRVCELLQSPDRVKRIQRAFSHRRRSAMLKLIEHEIRSASTHLRSHPFCVMLDPGPVCNLRCPFCPTTTGWSELKREFLKPEVFHRIAGNLRLDLVQELHLYNWGEPFLNPYLTDYIRYFSQHGTRTIVHTNFSSNDFDDRFLVRLVDSGLTTLIISIDGASQETYEKYRVGGDIQRVLQNMRRLKDVKSGLGATNPTVSYKMLLNRFNEHEQDDARRLAQDCGAEFVVHENFWMPNELRTEWMARSVLDKRGQIPVTSQAAGPIPTECRQLWDTVIVNANGDVFPCCLVCKPRHAVGNLAEQDIRHIWNNEKMQKLRRYVTDVNAGPLSFDNACEVCPNRSCVHQKLLPDST